MTAEVYASGKITCIKLCSSAISDLRQRRFMPASELKGHVPCNSLAVLFVSYDLCQLQLICSYAVFMS